MYMYIYIHIIYEICIYIYITHNVYIYLYNIDLFIYLSNIDAIQISDHWRFCHCSGAVCLGFELGANIGQLTVHHLRQPVPNSENGTNPVTAERHQRRDSELQHLQILC